MSEKQLEPARTILSKVGIQNAQRVTGKSLTRVYRWMASKERGGTGGLIPSEEARKLLQYAKAEGIDLRADDFLLPLTPERFDQMFPDRASEGAAA